MTMTAEQRRAIPYEVAFEDNGITRYGVVEKYDDRFEQALEEGHYLVADCLTPTLWKIPIDRCTPHETNYKDWQNDAIEVWLREDYDKAKEQAAANPQDKISVGDIFVMPVADGHAWYLITKVNKKTFDVEWRGWGGGDRYTDRVLGYGGRFRIEDYEFILMCHKKRRHPK